MPIYCYFCENCGHEFLSHENVEDRHKPTEKPCPECGEKEVKKDIGNFAIGDAMKMGIRRPSAAFRNRLKEIHKNFHGKGSNRYADDRTEV